MPNTVQINGNKIAPSKIVCVGQNYIDHIKEMGNQPPEEIVLFCKPNSAISTTLLAFSGEDLHYEAELCFAVEAGKLAYFGIGLDVTKRAQQKRLRQAGLPWEMAKAFDGSALFSEFLPLDCASEALSFQLLVNNELTQQGDESLMLFKPNAILKAIQQSMSLQDGDIIMTGTPCGVGAIQKSALYEATVLKGTQQLIKQRWRAQ